MEEKGVTRKGYAVFGTRADRDLVHCGARHRPGTSRSRSRHAAGFACFLAVVAVALGTATFAFAGPSSTASWKVWGVKSGSINAIAVSGSTAYIGGSFTSVGQYTGGLASVDASSAAVGTTLPPVVGTVHAVAPDGSGGVYVGGVFTNVGGVARSNLAHILSNGTVDSSWNPAPTGEVDALAVSGSTVFVGGQFNKIDGDSSAGFLAAVDATTGALKSGWSDSNLPNNNVSALAVSGSTVYVGGAFTSVGGDSSAKHLAALSTATGALQTGWLDSNSPDASVAALVVSGSTLYVGGSFTTIAGDSGTGGLAALDATTGALHSGWVDSNGAPGGGTVTALALASSNLFVSGTFPDTIGGDGADAYLAKLNATTGAADTAWDAQADGNGSVYPYAPSSLTVSGSTLFVGGTFTSPRSYLLGVDTTSGSTSSWTAPTLDSGVNVVLASGSTLYVGGSFTIPNAVTRNRIAAIDLSTGQPTSWTTSVANSTVNALAVSSDGSTLYAAGSFTGKIAKISTSTGTADATWDSAAKVATGSAANALALSPDGSTLYLGGAFTVIGTAPTTTSRANLVALSTSTGAPTSWNPSAQSTVNALVLSSDGSTLYAGGAFNGSTGGDAAAKRIAAISTTTAAANTTFDAAAGASNGSVLSLALSPDGSTLYAGGSFTSLVNDSGAVRIAKLDASTGAADTTWDGHAAANNNVTALAATASTVYAGGSFTTIGGASDSYGVALDATTGSAGSWSPSFNQSVSALAIPGTNQLLAGGSFTAPGDRLAFFDAAATPSSSGGSSSPAPCTVGAAGCAGTVALSGGSTSSTSPSVTVPSDAFTQDVSVALTLPRTALSASGTLFDSGSSVVQLSVTEMDGSTLDSFAAPLVLHFPAGSGSVPAFSADGTTWSTIPQLASPALPAGQSDGYYVNADGSIDIYTMHATYFGVVSPLAPTAPDAPVASWRNGALALTWTGVTDGLLPVAKYEILLDGKVVATSTGTSIRLRTFTPGKPSRFTIVGVDPLGQDGAVSATIVVGWKARPASAPRILPGWAWKLLAWQQKPKASRGARPKAAPAKLPAWWWAWRAWRLDPHTIQAG